MKILALMTLDIFRFSLGDSLQQLGHEVRYLGEFDAEQLDAEIGAYEPDLIIDMGWDVWQQDCYQRGELDTIRDIIHGHGIFHVYFAEEDWLHFDRWSKRYCEIMRPSLILTRSPLSIPRYTEMGLQATFMDVGCNPYFHTTGPPEEEFMCDVAIVANGNFTIGELRYKSIYDLVTPLLNQSRYDVRIWGNHWDVIDRCYPGMKMPPHMAQGKLPFHKTPSVYRSAKICISIQTCLDQLSNRTMDILACGGFLLTSDTKAVREKLRPGMNCIASASPEETMQLIDYYIEHEDERRQIAEEGRKLALSRFAYTVTLREIWPQIERAWEEHQQRKLRTQASSMNLIANGQFHEADRHWITCHAIPVNVRAHHHVHSILLKGGTYNAYIQQKVAVTPGSTYLFNASLAITKKGTGAPISIFIQYYTSDDKLISFGLYHTLFATDLTDEWFAYRGITTRVPDEAAYALVLINKTPYQHSRPVLVSDCRLIEISV